MLTLPGARLARVRALYALKRQLPRATYALLRLACRDVDERDGLLGLRSRLVAALGDPREQRLRRQRPIDAATSREAVSRYSTHTHELSSS